MTLCNDNHEEICYESRHCPLCSVISDKDDEISSLRTRVEELKDHITELEESEAE